MASAQVKVATESVANNGISATRVPSGLAMQMFARSGARMIGSIAILSRLCRLGGKSDVRETVSNLLLLMLKPSTQVLSFLYMPMPNVFVVVI